MSEKSRATQYRDSEIASKQIELFPIRIIPVDIGYKINHERLETITRLINQLGYKSSSNTKLFGENAILEINCSEYLRFHLFADGIGVFSFEDQSTGYCEIKSMDAETILSERRAAHRGILNHSHRISVILDRLVELLRSVVPLGERRKTSHPEWESGGLSYVMSFYLIDAPRDMIENPKIQEWVGNLLFTDKHNYFGATSDFFEKEKREQIMTNIDVLNDIHVCHSWATMIVLGKLQKEHRQYYVDMEIVLQHIWMFAYITEQHIDMFLGESDKRVSSKKLTAFYDTLIDMTLIVKKYDTVISSTVHERELRLFNALKESSKLEILKKGIDDKSQILESKLAWAVDQKRLRSDRNTELFITILTIIQLLSGFGLGVEELIQPTVLYPTILCLFVFFLLRIKD